MAQELAPDEINLFAAMGQCSPAPAALDQSPPTESWGPRSEAPPLHLPAWGDSVKVAVPENTRQTEDEDVLPAACLQPVERSACHGKVVSSSERQENRLARMKEALAQHHQVNQAASVGRKQRFALTQSFKVDCSDGVSVKCIVQHPMFDTVAAVMIIVNSILMGWETEALTTNISMPESLEIMMILCSVYFCLEILMRLAGLRTGFFVEESRNWNLFDLGLVLLSLVDTFILYQQDGLSATNVVAGVKTLKMLRIIRVFRVFRFSSALSRVALMIVDSMKSLLWALIMLAIVVYVFAISLTTNAADWIKLEVNTGNPNWLELVQTSSDPTMQIMLRRFGSLSKTAYTLVQAMLGGFNWGEVADVLMDVDVISPALLLLYVAFTMLAVLNVITGAFVDNALNLASQQRDFQIEREIESKEQYASQIRALFQTIDDDGSGDVSRKEIREMLEDATLSAYFRVLGFETTDADLLFKLLDVDDSDTVSMQEFLDGCGRLKGPARNMDVHAILAECRRMRKALGQSLGSGA